MWRWQCIVVVELFERFSVLRVGGKLSWGEQELHCFCKFALFDQFGYLFACLFCGRCWRWVVFLWVGGVLQQILLPLTVVLESAAHELCLCVLGVVGGLAGS